MYLIAVIVLGKNLHKSPIGASFCLMAFVYLLKPEMISKHCSTKDYQQLLAVERERVKENLRGAHGEINFRLFNLRMAEAG